ncbi:hypothetical protein J6590_055092, partial [Homalodisca vitripennis]
MVEQRSSLNVCSYFRPGARFDQVVEEVGEITKGLTSSDYLLVMAGTNNVEKSGVKQLMSDVHTLINNTKHTTLLLATLPMRHDRWELDKNITKINVELENTIEVYDDTVKLLPLHLLPPHMFTAHGLHMNRRGKNRVAEMIKNLAMKKLVECEAEVQISTSTLHSGVKPTTMLSGVVLNLAVPERPWCKYNTRATAQIPPAPLAK